MILTRTLGRSGLALSEIGLGCATLAFDVSPGALVTARATLSQARAAGMTYFDTAPFYGRGLSERLTGDALLGDTSVTVSSKVGRLLVPDPSVSSGLPFRVHHDYGYDAILRSFEDSQQRMGRGSIDILLAHDLGRMTHGDAAEGHFKDFFEGGYRALEELRRAGDIRAIGLGVNETEICKRALQHGDFDLFLLAGRYSLLERTGAAPLFAACAKAGTDIVVGGPFNSGLLVGGNTYNYRAIPPEISACVQRLRVYCDAWNVPVGAAAIQFPLRHSRVKSVIPGLRTPDQLNEILVWSAFPIPEGFWAELPDT